MSRESIQQALKDFGLTEKEAEIYIFLAKHGVLTGGEVSKQTKTHRALTYRILKSLQKKGVVESTLESPVRFFSVPFEKLLDENIRVKQEEAVSLEKAKTGLLSDWKNISSKRIEPDVGKFVVIEGNRKIYSKISQMINETKSQFSAILTIPELIRNEQFGVFDTIYDHRLKSKIKFQFLTEISNEYLKAVKLLNKNLHEGFDLKARNHSSSFSLLPRMVARDNEEILFFISPKTDMLVTEQNEKCICTNNKSLVQTLIGIFTELWQDSEDIEKKILEIETVKPPAVPYLLGVAKKSRREWLILETIQYYLQALELMKDHAKWSRERTETLEALGGLYGLVGEHEKANECYEKGIASTDDEVVKDRMRRKIQRKKIVENDGVKLAYYVYGEGQPTIFLLAWNATAELWIPQVTYFSQNYKVVTVDMRGTGESDKPQGEYTIDVYVNDMKSIIDDLQDEDIIFVGSYFGGKIAVKYVTCYPGKISKLVLLSCDPASISAMPGFNEQTFEENHEKMLKFPSLGVKRFWEKIIPEPRFEALREWGLKTSEKTPPEIFVKSFYSLSKADVCPLLSKIDVPTLIVGGDTTAYSFKKVKYLQQQISGSKAFVFGGLGLCFLNMKAANKFNKLLDGFITTGELKG
jgi:sugar-specific transcriptional regulator TrmB/pimeloyl-ACP methyl ester carboxylesterase